MLASVLGALTLPPPRTQALYQYASGTSRPGKNNLGLQPHPLLVTKMLDVHQAPGSQDLRRAAGDKDLTRRKLYAG